MLNHLIQKYNKNLIWGKSVINDEQNKDIFDPLITLILHNLKSRLLRVTNKIFPYLVIVVIKKAYNSYSIINYLFPVSCIYKMADKQNVSFCISFKYIIH